MQAAVTTIIDPAHNPEAKSLLLSGQLNAVQCPNCGNASTAAAPLVYHDASRELLVTFVPMQLSMSKDESDKYIGTLIREVTKSMDSKLVKGYILQPKQAITMQGLIEQVLAADGVTPEMIDQQKERSRLAQMFLQTDPSTYDALVEEHDAKLDVPFFQTMSTIAQRYVQEGRQDKAEHVLNVQQAIAERSSVGKELIQQTEDQEKLVVEVAEKLQTLSTHPTPADVVSLVLPYAEDDERLQAFVGLARPLFDYAFFQEVTTQIEKVPDDQRPHLETLRDTIQQLTQLIDQQSQMQLQAAANVLRQILAAPDPQTAIQANLQLIDDAFMTVLEMNIQEAERQHDLEATTHLKSIRDQVMAVLQSTMKPEVRFINDLLLAPSEADARAMIEQQAPGFGVGILEVFDALNEVMVSQGQPQMAERLRLLRGITENVLSGSN